MVVFSQIVVFVKILGFILFLHLKKKKNNFTEIVHNFSAVDEKDIMKDTTA